MENTFLEKLNNTKLFKLMSIEKSIVEGKLVEFTETDISDYNTKMMHELKDLVEYLNTNTNPNEDVESDIVIEENPGFKIPTVKVNKLLGKENEFTYTDDYLLEVGDVFGEFSGIFIFIKELESLEYSIRDLYRNGISKKIKALLKWTANNIVFSIANTTCKTWSKIIRYNLDNNQLSNIGQLLGVSNLKSSRIDYYLKKDSNYHKLNTSCKQESFVCLGDYILKINSDEISSYLNNASRLGFNKSESEYFYTMESDLRELMKFVDKVVINNIIPVTLLGDPIDRYNGSLKTTTIYGNSGRTLQVNTSKTLSLIDEVVFIKKSNVLGFTYYKTGIDYTNRIRLIPEVAIKYLAGNETINIRLNIQPNTIKDFFMS